MEIQCIVKAFRSPTVNLGEASYTFARNKRGHWTVNVENPAHSGLLLSRIDAFVVYDEAAESAKDAAREAEAGSSDDATDDDDSDTALAEAAQAAELERLQKIQDKLERDAALEVQKKKLAQQQRREDKQRAKDAAAKGKATTASIKTPAKEKAEPAADAATGEPAAPSGAGMRFLPPDEA